MWRPIEAAPEGTTGCPLRRARTLIERHGLRATRQRVALGWLMFSRGDRHLTADLLHMEAQEAGMRVSLATVYNVLNRFSASGLVRSFTVDGRTYFDTNTSEHHHYLVEDDGSVMDIPADAVRIDGLPQAPEGFEIDRVEVVVRLRRVA